VTRLSCLVERAQKVNSPSQVTVWKPKTLLRYPGFWSNLKDLNREMRNERDAIKKTVFGDSNELAQVLGVLEVLSKMSDGNLETT
ncbi:hypothetical protein CSKR_203516, partial [Clonorchis sinensis]